MLTSVPGAPSRAGCAPQPNCCGPTSGPGSRPLAKRDIGFSLIELLVVLMVLGIATALVSVRLWESDHSRGQRLAEELAATLEHAGLSAQWRGRNLLWQAQDQTWRFLETSDDAEPAWQAITGDTTLAARPLPTDTALLQLEIAGVRRPQLRLRFAAHGINDPFRLRFVYREQIWELHGDILGKVAIHKP